MAAVDGTPQSPHLTSPGQHAALVSPSDSADFANVSRALWVGTAGDIKITTQGGETLVWPSVTVGWHPMRLTRIWATGTTATGMMVVW